MPMPKQFPLPILIQIVTVLIVSLSYLRAASTTVEHTKFLAEDAGDDAFAAPAAPTAPRGQRWTVERDVLFAARAQPPRRQRRRRAPAVWGEPAPDYSTARLHGDATFLYALLFVDAKISEHYERDSERVKAAVMKLAQEANRYFYQINLRLIIVDIVETQRNDLTLYTFEHYRNQRIRELPYHNFAALISYRYAGGLAFVSGMCSAKSVMLAGFYPHNPEAMGSIFFHEVAHLIGVPHMSPSETLSVPNCACAAAQNGAGAAPEAEAERESLRPRPLNNLPVQRNNNNNNSIVDNNFGADEPRATRPPKLNDSCLRIPGFDHDCTLQLMANLVHRNRCLSKELILPSSATVATVADSEPRPDAGPTVREGEAERRHYGSHHHHDDDDYDLNALYSSGRPASYRSLAAVLGALPLCGNGVRERGEDCDCGLERLCAAWNCSAATCTRPVPLWIIYACTVLIAASILAPLCAYIHLRRRYRTPSGGGKRGRCSTVIREWASVCECYSMPRRLARSLTVPEALKKLRPPSRAKDWLQARGKFGRDATGALAGAEFERAPPLRHKFFRRAILGARGAKGGGGALDDAEEGGCGANFLRRGSGGADARAAPRGGIFARAFLWAKRVVFARNNNKIINNNKTTNNNNNRTESEEQQQRQQSSMKFIRVFSPQTNSSTTSPTFGHYTPHTTHATHTPHSSASAAAAASASSRPRFKPPPPPNAAASHSPTASAILSPRPSAAQAPPILICSAAISPTGASAKARPKVPPPPRPHAPPLSTATRPTSASSAHSDATTVSVSGSGYGSTSGGSGRSVSARRFLPPPPPPPPTQRCATVEEGTVPPPPPMATVLRADGNSTLPRPPSFAPPTVPTPLPSASVLLPPSTVSPATTVPIVDTVLRLQSSTTVPLPATVSQPGTVPLLTTVRVPAAIPVPATVPLSATVSSQKESDSSCNLRFGALVSSAAAGCASTNLKYGGESVKLAPISVISPNASENRRRVSTANSLAADTVANAAEATTVSQAPTSASAATVSAVAESEGTAALPAAAAATSSSSSAAAAAAAAVGSGGSSSRPVDEEEDRYSISHKFADFDDDDYDFESEFDESNFSEC